MSRHAITPDAAQDAWDSDRRAIVRLVRRGPPSRLEVVARAQTSGLIIFMIAERRVDGG